VSAGFPQLLRAEWTKLRTVRGWGLTLLAAVLVTVLISLFSASSASVETTGGGPPMPTGPDGRAVHDNVLFLHRALAGDGSVTARVTGPHGVEPERAPEWAKAGLLVRESAEPGSAYAALMLTARHGVRLQSGFTSDVAGSAAAPDTPHWLRLTREGTTVTGHESADGHSWTEVGTVELDGAAGPVEAGLFVASPPIDSAERRFGNVDSIQVSSLSTGRFEEVTVDDGGDPVDAGDPGNWERTHTGARPGDEGEVRRDGDAFTLTGDGDIGPLVQETDLAATALNGTQLGLVLIAALGVLFITAEYRRGLIRTTFLVSPRRGRVLAAKSVVIGGAAFAAGLVAALGSFVLSVPVLRDNGHRPPVFADVSLGDGPVVRAVVGTAVVLALIAVLALALGALTRGTAAAITTVVVVFVLPLVLVGALPLGLSQAIQRFTPVAGFAIQSTTPRYEQVTSLCLPENGCYPQGPWTGLATLAAYTAAVLALAVWRIRKRDA
jgi:hypothetical protein